MKKTRKLAERIREQRELLQMVGPRALRRKRPRRVLDTRKHQKRACVRRKVRQERRGPLPDGFDDLIRLICRDDGSAARAHLAAGRPIYYREHNTEHGMCVKEYPDGSRELVHFDETGEVVDRRNV